MYMILLSSGLLILLLIVLRPFMRKRVSPLVIYSLWLLVALRLLLPFQLGASSLSLENLFQKNSASVQAEVNPQPQSPIYPDVQIESPLYPDVQTAPPVITGSNSGQNPQDITPEASDPVMDTPITNTTPIRDEGYGMSSTPDLSERPSNEASLTVTTDAPAFSLTTAHILNGVWLAGFLAMVVWFLAVNIRFRRKATAGATELSLPDLPIPVYESESVPSPCMTGLFRPQIFLLPGTDPYRQKHILTHELTHYRHRDHIWSFVRCLCLCIYWFNPLVWIAAYLSKEDCELACDYDAIKTLGEEERLPYGKTLLDTLVQANRPGNLLRSATTMGGGKKQIRTRLESIVKKPKKLLWALLCLILVVALSVGCTFTGRKDVTQAPEENPTESTFEMEPTETDSTEATTATEEVIEPTESPSINNPSGVALLDCVFYDIYPNYEEDGYIIPRLVLESGYGDQVQQELLELFGMAMAGDHSQYSGITYSWYITVLDHFDPSPQILVLDITATTVQESTETLTYYVDLTTGTAFTPAQYAEAIRHRVSLELVQDLYDEFVNNGTLSFTSEDRKIYLENLSDSYEEATFALTEKNTLAITVPYITRGSGVREITMDSVPTESISVNAFQEPSVIDLYTYFSGDDGRKNTLPLILLESNYAKEFNAEILQTYLTMQPNNVKYTWAINGNILSFAMEAENPYTYGIACIAENLFLDGQSQPSAQDVLAQAKEPMTYGEYKEKAKVLLRSYFFDLFPGISKKFPNDQLVLKQVLRSGSDANIDLSKPYLDAEGNIWTYADIYQIAGSSHVPHLIPISTAQFNEEYLAYVQDNSLFSKAEQILTAYLETLYGEGTYDLIYTARNACPEYTDSKIHAEGLEDHLVIRIYRELDPTLTEYDIDEIPELKAACELLGVEDVEYIVDGNQNATHEMYVMNRIFDGIIDRFVKVVEDSANKEVRLLIYWG